MHDNGDCGQFVPGHPDGEGPNVAADAERCPGIAPFTRKKLALLILGALHQPFAEVPMKRFSKIMQTYSNPKNNFR